MSYKLLEDLESYILKSREKVIEITTKEVKDGSPITSGTATKATAITTAELPKIRGSMRIITKVKDTLLSDRSRYEYDTKTKDFIRKPLN